MDKSEKLLLKEDAILLGTLTRICKERLTKKQKKILEFLLRSEENGITSTSLVRILSKEIKCSRSTLWNNLNQLKKCGLVDNSSGFLSLTGVCKIIIVRPRILRGLITNITQRPADELASFSYFSIQTKKLKQVLNSTAPIRRTYERFGWQKL